MDTANASDKKSDNQPREKKRVVLVSLGSVAIDTIPQIQNDIKKLIEADISVICDICNIATEIIVSSTGDAESTFQKLESIASKHSSISIRTLKNGCRALLILLKGGIKYNVGPNQFKADLEEIGFSTQQADAVCEIYKENFSRLVTAFAKQTASMNELVDIKWSFGVTVATDEVKHAGVSYIHLRLFVRDDTSVHPTSSEMTNNITGIRQIGFDMTVPEFFDFLAEMERAKAFADYLIEPSTEETL